MISKQSSGTVIDVREPYELFFGKVDGSINIPMGQVAANLERLKKLPKPLVFICASGNRSGQVVAYLHKEGWTDVHNGGGWKSFSKQRAA
jgi:rhodanese-related sulfurtransferase